MTPLPKPKHKPRSRTYVRRELDGIYPLKSSQRLFTKRRPAPTMAMPTDEWIAAQFAHSRGRPYFRDTIEATEGAVGGNEEDAGWLAKLPGVVGADVPLSVAMRLYEGRLVRKVEK